MGAIQIRQIKGNSYAYYIFHEEGRGKVEQYIGPVENTSTNPGLNCPRCKMRLDEQVLRTAITNHLSQIRIDMIKNNEHFSNYSTYAIVEELIKLFGTK